MRLDSNRSHQRRYTFWAPVYDAMIGVLAGARRESLRRLDAQPGERVLIVGAGTGLDLPHVPLGCRVLATDLTRAMLGRARSRVHDGVRLALMDGQKLAVPCAAFDAVVLHLVLALVSDPERCLQEAARVLRPGGRIVVLDKFVRRGRVPLALRALNPIARVMFTDLTRDFQAILERSGVPLTVALDAPARFWGLYRNILLRPTR